MKNSPPVFQVAEPELKERVFTDFEIRAKYIGPNPTIRGKVGKCYYSRQDDKWVFLYGGEKYMVADTSLDISEA